MQYFNVSSISVQSTNHSNTQIIYTQMSLLWNFQIRSMPFGVQETMPTIEPRGDKTACQQEISKVDLIRQLTLLNQVEIETNEAHELPNCSQSRRPSRWRGIANRFLTMCVAYLGIGLSSRGGPGVRTPTQGRRTWHRQTNTPLPFRAQAIRIIPRNTLGQTLVGLDPRRCGLPVVVDRDISSKKPFNNNNGTTMEQVCNGYTLQTRQNLLWHLLLTHFLTCCWLLLPFIDPLPL